MRTVLSLFLLLIVLVAAGPYILYGYGLTLVSENARPPFKRGLSLQQLNIVWIESGGVGSPQLRRIGPWGYIGFMICVADTIVETGKKAIRSEDYPGVAHASFAVRNQTRASLRSNYRNLEWQLAWVSQTILAARTWTIDDVLSTYAKEHT